MAALATQLRSATPPDRLVATRGVAAERLGRFASILESDDVVLFYHSSAAKMRQWQSELLRDTDGSSVQPLLITEANADACNVSGTPPPASHTGRPDRTFTDVEEPGACQSDDQNGYVVLQSARDMLQGSTGCHLWPAALWLAQHVLQNPGLVRGKCVLELGCGVGLLGVILARCSAAKVRSSRSPVLISQHHAP